MTLLRLLSIVAASISVVRGLVLSPELPTVEDGLDKRQAMPRPGELVDFQVYSPVLVPEGSSNKYGCIHKQTLMEYTFRNSYGAPFVGNYTPPPCDFNRVVINLTVTSEGVQYDRLALMYLSDTEVFRTSTAEPTSYGIIWTYIKEMQQYNALWKKPQKLIFDLGNIQNSQYTGAYETTLTATFFTVPDSPAAADEILPISSRSSASNSGIAWQVPGNNASVQYTLPKDVNRAVVSLSACGQSDEEFWYSNAPNSAVDTFDATSGTLLGGGTFREVQLLIDGQLSGVSWPFPVIFTGGINPGFWRPIVGIDAFDLRQHEIDITPWLGYLLDGKNHTFEIRVASVNDDGHGHATLAETPTSYWLVSGSIFLYRDPNGKPTTGTSPKINTPQIGLSTTVSTTKDVTGQNKTLTYTTKASRSIQISSKITTGNGTSSTVTWTQNLSYSNYNLLTAYGDDQLTKQTTTGNDVALAGGNSFSQAYTYPLTVNSSYIEYGAGVMILANFVRGKQQLILGNPVFPTGLQNFGTSSSTTAPTLFGIGGETAVQTLPAGAANVLNGKNLQGTTLNNTQIGSAVYSSDPGYAYGTTEEWFNFTAVGANGGGVSQELYDRHVKAVNSTVVSDQQTFLGRTYSNQTQTTPQGALNGGLVPSVSLKDVRQFLGRGPGLQMQALNARGGQSS